MATATARKTKRPPPTLTTSQTILLINVQRLSASEKKFCEVTDETFNDYAQSWQKKLRYKMSQFLEDLLRQNIQLSVDAATFILDSKHPSRQSLANDIGILVIAKDFMNAVAKEQEVYRPSFDGTFSSRTPDSEQGNSAAGACEPSSCAIVAEVLATEVLPNLIGLITLTPQQIDALSRSHVKPDYTFLRILQHWAASKSIPHMTLDYLLSLLHAYKPTINYASLPKSSKTVLAIKPADRARCKIKKFMQPTLRCLRKSAEYVHFGILGALLGTSPGLVSKWQWIYTLRSVYTLFPDMFPPEFLSVIRAGKGEEFDAETLKKWKDVPSPPSITSPSDLVILIHGHIDGVQWFKNSTRAKGVPILCRVVGIINCKTLEEVKIPDLDPFVVGVMQVEFQTPTHKFVKDFVKELKLLSNLRKSGLSFRVELICMICDAPQRAECKGIVQHTGYYACERCRVRGVHVVRKNARCYPQLNAPPRLDNMWDRYTVAEKNEKVKKRKHRLRPSMFQDEDGKVIVPFPHVSGFALESMHLIDGGVILDFMTQLAFACTNVKFDQNDPNSDVYSILETDIEEAIKCLNPFTLSEQPRKLRSLTAVDKFKMRELHVFFMYYLYFVFAPFASRVSFGLQLLAAMKELLLGLHLTKGFLPHPIPEKDLQAAQGAFEEFLRLWGGIMGDSGFTLKVHELLHILQDCRRYKCTLEYLSSYIYENFHGKWKNMLRSGHLAVAQIRNRLIEINKYTLPPSGTAADKLVPTPKQATYMLENRTLGLPPDMFVSFSTSTRKGTLLRPIQLKHLEFVGFTVSNWFPQNVCLMRDGNVVFCDDFVTVEHDDVPVIKGHKFLEKTCVYDEPYDSRDIGMATVTDIDYNLQLWRASDVASKCLILPAEVKQTLKNPLPNRVRIAKNKIQAIKDYYGNQVPAWNIVSILLVDESVRALL